MTLTCSRNEVATVAGLAGCGMDGTVNQPVYGGRGRIIGYGPFFIALSLFDIISAIILWY